MEFYSRTPGSAVNEFLNGENNTNITTQILALSVLQLQYGPWNKNHIIITLKYFQGFRYGPLKDIRSNPW